MDGHQFDALLTRAVAARRSLLTSLLAGVIGGTAIDVAESKRKKKKKKKKKLSGPFQPCKRERDCLPKHSCFANECVPECDRSEQCPFGYFCARLDEIDLDFGLCQQGCDNHGYCETVLGTRLSRCNFSTNQCEFIECINDGDCTPPDTCRDNFTCTCPECPPEM